MSVRYTEAVPQPALAPFVRRYWTVQSPGGAGGEPWRVLPDGCADWMVDLTRAAPAEWVGTMTRPIWTPVGPADLFGIRFQPGGLHALTGMPLHPLTDLSAPAGPGTSFDLRPLEDALAVAPDFAARCRAADTALVALMPRASLPTLARLLGWLERREELPRVEALAQSAGFTLRTLERRFKDAVGVRPKQHLRYLRFERARVLLERGELSGAEVAAEAGYVDEAHFIHEFRRFTGETPNAYRVGFLQSRVDEVGHSASHHEPIHRQ